MAVKAQIEHANARPWVVKSNLTSLFIGDFFSKTMLLLFLEPLRSTHSFRRSTQVVLSMDANLCEGRMCETNLGEP
jgi:hypothetical protein